MRFRDASLRGESKIRPGNICPLCSPRTLGLDGTVEEDALTASGTRGADDRRGIKTATFTQEASKVLQKWFFDNFGHPYPEKEDKDRLCSETGLTAKQLNDWFSNWRKRVWNRGMANQPKPDMSKAMDVCGSGWLTTCGQSSAREKQQIIKTKLEML